jgi:hypothetical protein
MVTPNIIDSQNLLGDESKSIFRKLDPSPEGDDESILQIFASDICPLSWLSDDFHDARTGSVIVE